jgi:7-keto-8-aminopelargonate synthetase-like enzyme
MESHLVSRMEAIRANGLERVLRPLVPLAPTRALLDNQEVDVFSSNDYLGLAWNPAVRDAWQGAGCGSSRLLSGTRPAHRKLEDSLEDWFGQPALVFSSGYQANLAVLTTLFQEGQHVGSDALNHASIIDGLRLSKATRHILPHDESLPAQPDLDGVVVEGLYSMDGDTPDFGAHDGGCWLVVDEAHAVGAIGPGGRGVAAHQGIRADVLVGTFGKAYGAAGAFVVGPAVLKELMISSARSFVYTTALAEPATRAAHAGFQAATNERRERLADRVRRFRTGLLQLGLESRGAHHIVPVLTQERTMEMAAQLEKEGIYVPGIRAPTVPPGSERLRFSLSSEHTDDQIDRALAGLERFQ